MSILNFIKRQFWCSHWKECKCFDELHLTCRDDTSAKGYCGIARDWDGKQKECEKK